MLVQVTEASSLFPTTYLAAFWLLFFRVLHFYDRDRPYIVIFIKCTFFSSLFYADNLTTFCTAQTPVALHCIAPTIEDFFKF